MRDIRPASTAVLVRDGAQGLETLLIKRDPSARFLGGYFVFPGGTVGPGDDDGADTAVRETLEECGVRVDRDALVWFDHWVTPPDRPRRFDTRFYLALAPPHSPPEPDGSETVDAGWFAPRDALDAHAEGAMELVFPTIKHLESLLPYANAAEALEAARRREVRAVEPKVVGEGPERRIELPEDLP